MFGVEIVSMLTISSKRWPVFIFNSTMKIGCEMHLISEWKNFSDGEISKMNGDALKFWRENKAELLSICKIVNKAYKRRDNERDCGI